MDRRTFLALGSATLLGACTQEPQYEALNTTVSEAAAPPAGGAQVGSALQRLTSVVGRTNIWGERRSWSRNARTLHDYIQGSWAEGLQPTSYLPQDMNRGLGSYSAEKDLALSAAAIKLVSDLSSGRTRNAFDASAERVARLQGSGNLTQELADLGPSSGPCRQLRSEAFRALRRNGAASPGFSSLETTMEKLRLRPFPDIEGQVIVVNIPAFDLHAYNNGRPYLRSRVIVGKEGRETPVGRDYITNLKFSPDWTPPRSIINRDLVPALQDDPTSLDPLSMDIFVRGRKIEDVAGYDWNSVNPNSVTMHQPPGTNAILGGVRFTMNNSRAIYLHDTSARPLFGDTLRTASSGCIRVEQSIELADWLLDQDEQPKTMEELQDLMSREESEFVSLKRRVRVEMLYYTAWINDQGLFTLYPDVYGRDEELVAALARG